MEIDFNIYLALAINGLFTGLGVSLGTHIAQQHIISKGRKIVKKIKKKFK